MIESYICEKCGKPFTDRQKCLDHEEQCQTQIKHYCAKTGIEEIIDSNDPNADIKENRWHKINLGKMEYCSLMDGSNIEFELCDEALYDFIQSFKYPELVLN